MLWNASSLNGHPIKATDGQLGTVAGLLCDMADWSIRWVVVDTGDWLSGRQALLPVATLGQPDPKSHQLPVNLMMRQVKECPDTGANEPLSQEAATKILNHYDLPHNGDSDFHGGRGDTEVRSISKITGHTIEATDGDIGHAEDFLIDTVSWQVRYLIVDTSNWWAGEKVLISPLSIMKIDPGRSIIHLDVSRQKIKDSPRYVAAETVDGGFEESFQKYYGIR